MIEDHVNKKLSEIKAAHRTDSIAKAFQVFCQKHPEFSFSSNREFLARYCDENLWEYSPKNFALAASKIPFLLAKKELEPVKPPEPSPLEKRQTEIARLKSLSSEDLKAELNNLRGTKQPQPQLYPSTGLTIDGLKASTPDQIRAAIRAAHVRNSHV